MKPHKADEMTVESIIVSFGRYVNQASHPENFGKDAQFLSQAEAVAAINQRIAEAKFEGMNIAKQIVLRRTEIPKDARNPSRDAIVMLGEEIASIIDSEVQRLNLSREEGHVCTGGKWDNSKKRFVCEHEGNHD